MTIGLVAACLSAVQLPAQTLGQLWPIMAAAAAGSACYLWWSYRTPRFRSSTNAWLRAVLLHSGLVCAAAVVVFSGVAAQKQSWESAGFEVQMAQQRDFRVVLELSQAPQRKTDQFGHVSYQAPAQVLTVEHRDGVSEQLGAPWPVWLRSDRPLHYGGGTQLRAIIGAQAPPSLSRIQAFVTVRGPVEVVTEHAPDVFDHVRARLLELGRKHRTGFHQVDTSVAHERGSALIVSMIVGDTSDHDEQLRNEMKISGLSHLSAVSGANCALVFGVVTAGLRRLRLPLWLQMSASTVALLLFILVVGFEPSVLRAGVMGLVGAVAVFAGRGRKTLPLLYVACIILLLVDPWYVTDLAFQLSVAATWGIIIWGTKLSKLFPTWVPQLLAQAISVALAAQLATVPVLGPATGTLPTHSITANLLVTPLVPPITLLGTAALPFILWFPPLAEVLLYPVGWLTIGVGAVGHFSASLPGALLPWPEGLLGHALGAGLIVLVLVFTHVVDLQRYRRRAETNPRENSMVRIIRYGSFMRWCRFQLGSPSGWLTICVVLCCGVIGIAWWLRPTGMPDSWQLAACDVGQGDMFVLNTGEQAAVVIDAGPDPAAADTCLNRLGVTTIEHLFISHQHADHYGGVPGVAQDRAIDKVSLGTAGPTVLLPPLHAKPDFPLANQRFSFGGTEQQPDFTVTTLTPGSKTNGSENNASLILLVQLHESGVSILFTGDLEVDEFDRLAAQGVIPDQIDVLKVAHHGARNGSARAAQLIQPTLALISVGQENDYGHPHPEIVAALAEQDTQVLRTDELGSIWVRFSARGYTVGQF